MSDLRLPDGFQWLGRTGDAMPFVHVETGRTGAVPAVIIRTSGVNQTEVDYQVARVMLDVERSK